MDYEKIKQIILGNPLEENCGIILKNEEIIELKNISEERSKSFRINPTDIMGFSGEIAYIWHNHVVNPRRPPILDPRTPSKADLEGQIASGIPWLIFANDTTTVMEPLQIPRIPNNSYLDRPFCWYINDCYTLAQDYYLFELGITLPSGKIIDTNDIRKKNHIFDTYLEEYGFTELKDLNDLQNGDIFIIDNGGLHANHILIYDNGEVLHQDLLSKREPIEAYFGRFKKRLRYVG